jgi:D-sedoheptulose 7-phosphate isomerase
MTDEEYIHKFIRSCISIAKELDEEKIMKMASLLLDIRFRGGRLFVLGVGGGAGNASHAVCDFRKIAGIESYAATDNISEITARVNDEGWETVFSNWLRVSKLNQNDGILIFSVGGGNEEKNVSVNLVEALKYAKQIGARIIGVVGRDGGYTAKVADACIIVPNIDPENVTPLTESFQAMLWHLLVSIPSVKMNEMKWENTK